MIDRSLAIFRAAHAVSGFRAGSVSNRSFCDRSFATGVFATEAGEPGAEGRPATGGFTSRRHSSAGSTDCTVPPVGASSSLLCFAMPGTSRKSDSSACATDITGGSGSSFPKRTGTKQESLRDFTMHLREKEGILKRRRLRASRNH